ncbi:MAG: hypothetical protein ACOCXT_02065 [Candidatus Dojkabacteria bacterium]
MYLILTYLLYGHKKTNNHHCIIVLVLITGGVGTWIILVSRRDQSQESEINQESITLDDLNESTYDTAEEEAGSEGKAAIPTNATNTIMTLSTGTSNRIDAIHFESSDVSLIQQGERYFIKFEPTFSFWNGSDLYVYLAEPQEFSDTVNGVDTARTLHVGRLTFSTERYTRTPDKTIVIVIIQSLLQLQD